MVTCPCGAEYSPGATFCGGCGARAESGSSNTLQAESSGSMRARSASSEDLTATDSTSFWDVGNYKEVLKRINSGAKLCDELIKFYHERADIEKAYAKALVAWADRWEEKLDKTGEYGTLRYGWQQSLQQARAISADHIDLKERLKGDLSQEVTTWKTANFAKSFLHFKSHKRASSAFSKAQQPWAKRKTKIVKLQKELRSHEALRDNYNRAARDGSMETAKAETAARKSESDAQRTRHKLQQRIQEMCKYKDIYEREMRLEFDHCQDEERARIAFFKDSLLHFQKAIDLSPGITNSLATLLRELNTIDASADLAQFSREKGADMPFVLPTEDGFTEIGGDGTATTITPAASTSPPAAPAAAAAVASSDFPPSPDMPQFKDMPAGTKMRAMYDYEGANSDELSFFFDDIISLQPDPRCEPGWLKGTLENGSMGVFPVNYVELDEV